MSTLNRLHNDTFICVVYKSFRRKDYYDDLSSPDPDRFEAAKEKLETLVNMLHPYASKEKKKEYYNFYGKKFYEVAEQDQTGNPEIELEITQYLMRYMTEIEVEEDFYDHDICTMVFNVSNSPIKGSAINVILKERDFIRVVLGRGYTAGALDDNAFNFRQHFYGYVKQIRERYTENGLIIEVVARSLTGLMDEYTIQQQFRQFDLKKDVVTGLYGQSLEQYTNSITTNRNNIDVSGYRVGLRQGVDPGSPSTNHTLEDTYANWDPAQRGYAPYQDARTIPEDERASSLNDNRIEYHYFQGMWPEFAYVDENGDVVPGNETFWNVNVGRPNLQLVTVGDLPIAELSEHYDINQDSSGVTVTNAEGTPIGLSTEINLPLMRVGVACKARETAKEAFEKRGCISMELVQWDDNHAGESVFIHNDKARNIPRFKLHDYINFVFNWNPGTPFKPAVIEGGTETTPASLVLDSEYLTQFTVAESVVSIQNQTLWEWLKDIARRFNCYVYTDIIRETINGEDVYSYKLIVENRVGFLQKTIKNTIVSLGDIYDEVEEGLVSENKPYVIMIYNPINLNEKETRLMDKWMHLTIPCLAMEGRYEDVKQFEEIEGVLYDPINRTSGVTTEDRIINITNTAVQINVNVTINGTTYSDNVNLNDIKDTILHYATPAANRNHTYRQIVIAVYGGGNRKSAIKQDLGDINAGTEPSPNIKTLLKAFATAYVLIQEGNYNLSDISEAVEQASGVSI